MIVEDYSKRFAKLRTSTSPKHWSERTRQKAPNKPLLLEAAHIIPWSISHNDNPRNGVALCKLCHWMFDEGLLTISSKYAVIISPQLIADQNIPGHLVTLDGRGIVEPINEVFLPEIESLTWHYREIFRAKQDI